MAHIVLGVGSSHGPSIQTPPEGWARLAAGDTRDPRFDYQSLVAKARPGLDKEISPDVQRRRYGLAHGALKTLRERIAAAKPDIVVVVSNVHRVRPAEAHPVFGIYRGPSFLAVRRAEQPFDPDARFLPEDKRRPETSTVEMPASPALADHLVGSLIARGFDVACLDSLPEGSALDDAFTFVYEWLLDHATIPLLPLMVSRDLPNQAMPARCHDLGAALREEIAGWPADQRVCLIASGGLSHQIIDEELDRQVIDALVAGDAATLRALPRARLNGAPGTPEILNWVTVSAAMAPTPMQLIEYQPCYRSIAGTGHGLTFGYWQP